MNKGLGRRRSQDLRRHAYALTAPAAVPAGVTQREWNPGAVLDQGQTSECVAHAGTTYLNAGPVTNRGVVEKVFGSIHALYQQAQVYDEWPGEDYEGTSVNGLMVALRNAGLVSGFGWMYSSAVIASYILAKGPVVVGTDWYETMFNPENGWCRLHADKNPANVGGHSYALVGVNTAKKCPDGTVGAFRFQNSWGPSWGEKGRAWFGMAEFDVLMRNGGEAAQADEVKLPK